LGIRELERRRRRRRGRRRTFGGKRLIIVGRKASIQIESIHTPPISPIEYIIVHIVILKFIFEVLHALKN
jgi:hypothetical protein